MELIKNEKDLIVLLLKEHLKDVETNEKAPDENLMMLAAEEEYGDFLKGIIKKLKK